MTTPTAPRMTGLDWLCLITLSALWGGSFFFVKVAVTAVPPLTLVLLRVALAALALHAVLRVTGLGIPAGRRAWLDYAGMGILNNVIPFALIFYGQAAIGIGLAAVINGLTPFWTALIARAAGTERLSAAKLAGVAIGFGGLAVMVGPAAMAGLDASLVAQLAIVGATISYGCSGVFGRRFRTQPPLVTAAGQLTASSAMMLPLALLVDRPWTLDVPGGEVIAAVVALALVSTALAYILFFRVLASAGATNVSLVTLLVPVSAMLLGVLVLGETVTERQLLGLALIAAGLAFIDGRLLARLRPAPVDAPAIVPKWGVDASTLTEREDAMAEEILKRYAAAPLETADTYRISDTLTGSIVSVVKGKEAVRRRLDQLNAEETLRRRTG